MAVDRGELRYTIRIRDDFSGSLRRFRREIDSAKKSVESLANVRARSQGDSEQTREQRQRIRLIDALAKQQQRVERERGRLVRQQIKDRESIRKAIRSTGRELRKQGQIEARQSASRIRSLRAQTVATDKTAASVRRVRAETKALNRDGGRLLFTFRRLFGALAAFTLAREAAGAFRDLVSLGVGFNAQLAQGRLGFAGLLIAAGEVRDSQGQILQGAEAFNAALRVAGNLQLKLRQRALETTATAEELGFAFQQAIAPGLSRGLDPDQILDLTVSISQAASAIGLAQNQLAEETRSILQGTARAQTTRLAALFGGAKELNELVRGAKDADDLFQKLNERLSGTSEAARRAADILPGLFARTRDALALVAGTAAIGLFDTLESTLRSIFNALVVINEETGRLQANPELLPAFSAIFDVIDDLVIRAKEFGESVGFEGLITAARTLGAIVSVIGAGLLGVAQAVQFTAQAFGIIGDPFTELVGGGEELVILLTEIAQIIGLVIGSLVIARTTTFLWGAALDLVRVKATAAAVAVDGVAAATGRVRKGMIAIAAIITGVVFGFQQIFQAILGVDVTLADTLKIIRLSFSTAFGTVTRQGTIIFKTFADALVGFFTDPIGAIAKLFNDLILRPFLGAATALAEIGVISEQMRQDLDTAGSELEALLEARGKQTESFFDPEADKLALQDFLEEAQEKFTQLRADIAARGVLGPGFDKDLAKIKAAADDVIIGARPEGVSDQEKSALDTQRQRIALAQLETAHRRQLLILGQSDLTTAERAVHASTSKIALLEGQLRILEIQQQKLQDQTDEIINQAEGEERKQFLREKQGADLAEFRNKEAEITDEIKKQIALRKEEQLILSGTIDQGLARGLRNFGERFGSAFEAGIRIAEGVMNRFSSFLSQSIVDALDPTKDFDLIERFARFLQDIAQLVLQQLIQLAIARAILGGPSVTGKARGGLVTVPSFSGAEGGRVPGGPSYESHPPAGVPRSDTVAARLTPGEWVDPVSTVARMGADFFDALRSGAGDPLALRALVGLSAGKRARAKGNSRGFFQGGGIVGSELRRADAVAAQQQQAREGGGGQAVVALVPGNDQTVERLLAGGKRAMLDFIGENASSIDGMLSRNRTR